MPDHIAALSWEGANAGDLLAELYITEGPANAQKAALTKVVAVPGDLQSVLRRPRSVDVPFIMKAAFPTYLFGCGLYLKALQVELFSAQTGQEINDHLDALAAILMQQYKFPAWISFEPFNTHQSCQALAARINRLHERPAVFSFSSQGALSPSVQLGGRNA